MATVKSKKIQVLRAVGVREAARLTNMSPAHVWYIRHGQRKSARFERKMRDLGLTFEPATLRARHSLRSARLLPHGSQAPSRGGYALKRQGKEGK